MTSDHRENEKREYKEIDRTETLSLCSLVLIVGGVIALFIAEPTNIHLIAGGYTAISIGAIGAGALRGHATIMTREQRHHEETTARLEQIDARLDRIETIVTENRKLLEDTSGRADIQNRLGRIEQVLEEELRTLGDALQHDEVGRQRRNSR